MFLSESSQRRQLQNHKDEMLENNYNCEYLSVFLLFFFFFKCHYIDRFSRTSAIIIALLQ